MAANDTIAGDSTLEDVRDLLLDPERHIATVLGTMTPCRREHGNAHVRIGITGMGKVPYHKVVYVDGEGVEHLYAVYDGRNRSKDYMIHTNTWSTVSMSFAEVQSLLGKIRGFVQPGQPGEVGA